MKELGWVMDLGRYRKDLLHLLSLRKKTETRLSSILYKIPRRRTLGILDFGITTIIGRVVIP